MEGQKIENGFTPYGPITMEREVGRAHRNCWLYLAGISWLQNEGTCDEITPYAIIRKAFNITYGMPFEVFDHIWAEKLPKPKAEKVAKVEAPVLVEAAADTTNGLEVKEQEYLNFLLKAQEPIADKAVFAEKLAAFYKTYSVPETTQAKLNPILRKKYETPAPVLTF